MSTPKQVVVCPDCQGRGGYETGTPTPVLCATCMGKRLVKIAVDELETLEPFLSTTPPEKKT